MCCASSSWIEITLTWVAAMAPLPLCFFETSISHSPLISVMLDNCSRRTETGAPCVLNRVCGDGAVVGRGDVTGEVEELITAVMGKRRQVVC